MPTRNLQVYSNGTYVALEPVPLVGISDTFVRNEAGFLHRETTITLDGYALNTDPCTGNPESGVCPNSFSYPSAHGNGNPAGGISTAHRIRDAFTRGNNIDLRMANNSGFVEQSLNQCFVESINIEAGTWNAYVKYQVVLKSYTGTQCIPDNLSPGASQAVGIGHFNRLTPRDSGVLTDYSESFNIEQLVGEYGYANHTPPPSPTPPTVSSTYYKGSSSISVSAKSLGNRRFIGGGNSIEHATGWQIARDLFAQMYGDPNNLEPRARYLLNNGLFAYDESNTTSTPDSHFTMYNLTRRQSIDVHTGTFSITDDFIIAPTGVIALETWNSTYDSSNDSSSPTVTINGTIKGLSQLSIDNQSRSYVDSNASTPGPSGMIDYALQRYHTITNQNQYGNCALYNRAQSAAPHNLNSGPASISFSTNDVLGEVTYNITYDARPQKFFTGAITESINVEDTLPGDLYTTIPILGRPTGPILQYLYGRTEYRRTLSIDVLFDSNVVGNATSFPGSNRNGLIASKPSLRSGFREQLASLISAYSPANDAGILNYMQDPASESWNQSECRYTCTVSWVYELNS
jgi:hypothetical protein